MRTRVVMTREVRCARATRIMWRMWDTWGYSSRPCPESSSRQGWMLLEFWVDAPEASKDVLASYEWELDDALLSKKVKADFAGGGARIERSMG